MPCRSIAEFVKYSVSVRLLHFSVNVITRVTKFRDFLCQKFHTVDRVAKDNTLVDFQFREEGVEAVNLLPFLDIGIELCNTT